MGGGSGLYNFVLLLHITAVVAGFGAVLLDGVYARMADERGGAEGAAIDRANAAVGQRWARPAIYAVPVLGIALVLLSDGQWGFDQLWISLSFAVYAVIVVLAVVMQRARAATHDRPAPRQGSAVKISALSGALNLSVAVAIALMIWKPGA